jgi:hypothetical protein
MMMYRAMMITKKVKSQTNKAKGKEQMKTILLVDTGVVKMREHHLRKAIMLVPLAMTKLKMSPDSIEKGSKFKKVPTLRRSESGRVMSRRRQLSTVFLAKMKLSK